MKYSQQSIALRPIADRKVKSRLVRRLVQASDDPVKQRVRRLLVDIDDERLLRFGLTPDDIVVLHGAPESAGRYAEYGAHRCFVWVGCTTGGFRGLADWRIG